MFSEYLEDIRSIGRRHFTSQDIVKALGVSESAAKSGLYRLRKDGKLISPIKGLYVIIPPEHRSSGCIPADELVPIIMKHINANYYVGLLSAAAFYGASHQKPMIFQVVSNKRIKHSLHFGHVHLELIHKKSLANLPTQDFTVSTGYLKVATPELVAIDLLKFPRRVGGLNNIATVLSELIESIDVNKLMQLADNLSEQHQLQRLGYILEKIDVMEEDKKNVLIVALEKFVVDNAKTYVALRPAISKTGYPRSRKWKIIENTDIESDL